MIWALLPIDLFYFLYILFFPSYNLELDYCNNKSLIHHYSILILFSNLTNEKGHIYVMANVESGLELSQLNSSPQVWG